MDVNKKVTEVEEVAAGDVAVADGAAPSEKRVDKADIREKIFKYTAMVLLIGSFIYFTVYGFLSNPFLPSGTASEIGLKYPTAFKFWGFTTSLAYLYAQTAFEKSGFDSGLRVYGTRCGVPYDLRAYSLHERAGASDVRALVYGAAFRGLFRGGDSIAFNFPAETE